MGMPSGLSLHLLWTGGEEMMRRVIGKLRQIFYLSE